MWRKEREEKEWDRRGRRVERSVKGYGRDGNGNTGMRRTERKRRKNKSG